MITLEIAKTFVLGFLKMWWLILPTPIIITVYVIMSKKYKVKNY